MMESVTLSKEAMDEMEDVSMDEEEETIHFAEINVTTKNDDDNNTITTTPEEEEEEEDITIMALPEASPEENDWVENPTPGSKNANKEESSRRRMLACVILLAWLALISLAIALPLVIMNNKEEHSLPCTKILKSCPFGSPVGRDSRNNCEFFPCAAEHEAEPTEKPMVANAKCTMDVKECNDGSFVGRDPTKNCMFQDCPFDDAAIPTRSGSMDGPLYIVPPQATDGCPHELHTCEDGTLVNRSGPDCAFQPCPIPGAAKGIYEISYTATDTTTSSTGSEGCAEGSLPRCVCAGIIDFGNDICDITKYLFYTAPNTEAGCQAFCQTKCGLGAGSSFACYHRDSQPSAFECDQLTSSCDCHTLDGACPVSARMLPSMPFGEKCTAFCRRADVCGPGAGSSSKCGERKTTSDGSAALGGTFYKVIMAAMLAVVVTATI